MVFVFGHKYACATCVKGHRSSACHHSDRPLFEIKKKGRPITQCQHCRELRKTKQVHVKCMCSDKIKKELGHSSHSGLNLNAPDLPNGISDLLSSHPHHTHIPSPPEEVMSLQCSMSRTSSQDCHCAVINTSCQCGPTIDQPFACQCGPTIDQPFACQCGPTIDQPFVDIKQEPGILLSSPFDNQDITICVCSGQEMIQYSSDSEEGAQDQKTLPVSQTVQATNQLSYLQHPSQPQPQPQLLSPSADPPTSFVHWNSFPNLAMEESKVKLEAPQPTDPYSQTTPPTNQYEDDIDNDTPSFNSVELNNDQPRKETLLGPLQETSSEDLMNIIYSEFSEPNSTSSLKPLQKPSLPKPSPTCNSCNMDSLMNGVSCSDGSKRHLTTEDTRRMVTCRCGDNCACPGCLVHPREVMRDPNGDPYAGFEGSMEGVELDRNASHSPMDFAAQHSITITDDSGLLCSCGCMKPSDQCHDCMNSLCNFLPRNPQ